MRLPLHKGFKGFLPFIPFLAIVYLNAVNGKERGATVKTWRRITVLVVCLALAAQAACGCGNGSDEEIKHQLAEVVRDDLTVEVSGSGNIGVSNEIDLSFGVGGKVDEIYVSEGDRVTEGEVLARLNTSALELALLQSRATREQAAYNLNQLKDVQHASSDRVEVAELTLEAAEKAVAEARKQLQEATITAPFDGLVAEVYVEEGDILAPPTVASRPVIHLIDPAGMELTVEVDEIDIASVEPGQKVAIELDALPELQLEGEVVSISSLPEAEAAVVAYEVKIAFDVPPDAGLKVGMSADADIVIAERSNVLLVPDRAIDADSQGNPVVKVVVAEGETETRPVVTGISDGLQTEIVSGINEGETVVIEIRVKSTSPMGLF